MEDRLLEPQREIGVLWRWKFNVETCLDVLTAATQAVIDVMASPLALLVD
jgi:hypothetical protein